MKIINNKGQPQLSLIKRIRSSWDSPVFIQKLKGKTGQPLLSFKILEEARTAPSFSKNNFLNKLRGQMGQPQLSLKILRRSWDSPDFFYKRILGKSGQNAIEYILIFAAVIIVLLLALNPNGFITKAVDNSLNLSVEAIEWMANTVDDSP